ncbi:MAG: TetR/AcrR family transcriptional regulator [Solirubrobacteraceae bacterium]
MSSIATKPLRADARRNRQKVLAAASEAFAEVGLDAQVEDIARRASVGVGTVYRHFPTKEVLVIALAEQHFERLADFLEEACAADAEPWEALAAAIWRCAETTAGDVALCEILGGHPSAVQAAAVDHGRKEVAVEALIERARAQGTIRDDATANDIGAIMCGFGHIAAARRAGGEQDWRRYLTIALDGLRAR